MSDTRIMRIFSVIAAAAVCSLLIIIGAVVIPRQLDLSRQQEEALRNHNEMQLRQLLILERLSAVEAVAGVPAGRPPAVRPE